MSASVQCLCMLHNRWLTFIYKSILGLLPSCILCAFIWRSSGSCFLRSSDLYLLSVAKVLEQNQVRSLAWGQDKLRLENLITVDELKKKLLKKIVVLNLVTNTSKYILCSTQPSSSATWSSCPWNRCTELMLIVSWNATCVHAKYVAPPGSFTVLWCLFFSLLTCLTHVAPAAALRTLLRCAWLLLTVQNEPVHPVVKCLVSIESQRGAFEEYCALSLCRLFPALWLMIKQRRLNSDFILYIVKKLVSTFWGPEGGSCLNPRAVKNRLPLSRSHTSAHQQQSSVHFNSLHHLSAWEEAVFSCRTKSAINK